jgi:hypothetical protein
MTEGFQRVLDGFFAAHPEHAELEGLAYAFLNVDAAIAHLLVGARADAVRFLIRSFGHHAWEPSSRHACLSSLRRLKLLVRAAMGETLFSSVSTRARA